MLDRCAAFLGGCSVAALKGSVALAQCIRSLLAFISIDEAAVSVSVQSVGSMVVLVGCCYMQPDVTVCQHLRSVPVVGELLTLQGRFVSCSRRGPLRHRSPSEVGACFCGEPSAW